MSELEPSPAHLNFGEVFEDEQFSWILPVTNHGGQDIEIKRFRVTCTCSRIDPPSLVIPAGRTRDVRLTLDLTPRKPREFGASARDFAVGILPEVSGETDEGRDAWWTIRGRVRSPIRCDPPLVDLGRTSQLSQPLLPKRVPIKTSVALRRITATCTPSLLDVGIEKRSPKESESFDLIISPHGALPRGVIRCTVALTGVLTNGKTLPSKKVQVVGRIVGDIEASSPGIMFGACPVGTTAQDTIDLRSLTGRTFTVSGVRCEGDGLVVESLPEPSKTIATFRIEQMIRVKGEQQGKVIFSVRSDGGKDDEVTVIVAWFGTDSVTK